MPRRALTRLSFVTLCYRRPRRPPLWPYNLFAMVHGKDRALVEAEVEEATLAAGLSGRPRASPVQPPLLQAARRPLRTEGGDGMDDTDRRLVNTLLGGFPVEERPFAPIARQLGLEEAEVIRRLSRLRAEGVLTRFGPLYDAERLGGAVTLCAMQVPAGALRGGGGDRQRLPGGRA